MSHIYSRTYAVDSRLGFNIFPKPNFPGITSREHRFSREIPGPGISRVKPYSRQHKKGYCRKR